MINTRTISMFMFALLICVCELIFAEKPADVTLSGDTTIRADIIVTAAQRCVIAPGTTIRFEGYRTFRVYGLLTAVGTAQKPILFTGVGRERGSTQKPCWDGVRIMGKKAMGVFKKCRFEGAFMNCVWESSPVFDSCEFAGNHYALYSTRGAIPHITGCRIYRNVYGIVADFSSPLLLGNTITENRIGLFLERGSAALAAKNTIQNNQTDISSQESMGDNSSSLEMFKMWDMMRQLY